MANKLQEFMDVLAKAVVKNPGKRGGKFVRTKGGGVKYLSAAKKAKVVSARAYAATESAATAAQHKRALAVHLKAADAHRHAALEAFDDNRGTGSRNEKMHDAAQEQHLDHAERHERKSKTAGKSPGTLKHAAEDASRAANAFSLDPKGGAIRHHEEAIKAHYAAGVAHEAAWESSHSPGHAKLVRHHFRLSGKHRNQLKKARQASYYQVD